MFVAYLSGSNREVCYWIGLSDLAHYSRWAWLDESAPVSSSVSANFTHSLHYLLTLPLSIQMDGWMGGWVDGWADGHRPT